MRASACGKRGRRSGGVGRAWHQRPGNAASQHVFASFPYSDIVKLPPSALEGLAERCDPLFKGKSVGSAAVRFLSALPKRCSLIRRHFFAPLFHTAFHIHTIKDLASWKHARVAQALLALSTTEEKNKRAADSQMNINKVRANAFWI